MTTKTTDKVLRAVTQRVMDSFTAQGALFTALDVSNAVKGSLPDIRHREVAPLVLESLHLLVRCDSDIWTLEDLRGQRVMLRRRGAGRGASRSP